jgi:hypothetical protein
VFQEWWRRALSLIPESAQERLQLIGHILVAVETPELRLFEGASPSVVPRIFQDIREEARLWCIAGRGHGAKQFMALSWVVLTINPGTSVYFIQLVSVVSSV